MNTKPSPDADIMVDEIIVGHYTTPGDMVGKSPNLRGHQCDRANAAIALEHMFLRAMIGIRDRQGVVRVGSIASITPLSGDDVMVELDIQFGCDDGGVNRDVFCSADTGDADDHAALIADIIKRRKQKAGN